MKSLLAVSSMLSFLLAGVALGAEKEAYVYVDASTSVAKVEKDVVGSVRKLKEALERKGFNVRIWSFGDDVEELKSLESYKASEGDTNYDAVLDQLESSGEKRLVFLITDGRLPAKRLKELPELKKRISELQDAGVMVCGLSTLKEPTSILAELSAVVKPVGEEEELVAECGKLYEKLTAKSVASGEVGGNGEAAEDVVLEPVDIEERGVVKMLSGKDRGEKGKVIINVYQR